MHLAFYLFRETQLCYVLNLYYFSIMNCIRDYIDSTSLFRCSSKHFGVFDHIL